MMRKLSIIITIIIFILCNCFLTKVYAEGTNVCTIDASFNKNSAKLGEEIELSISTTQINEPIAGVGFSINYDSTIIEFVEANNVDGWTTAKTENLFTIFTNNSEAVSTPGKISGIIFKVKNNTEATSANITLTAVQVTKDDATSVNLDEINKTLTIDHTASGDENPTPDPNENPNQDPNGDPNQDPNGNPNQNPNGDPNQDPNEEPKQDSDENGNNQENINGNENNQENPNTNGSDNTNDQNTKEDTSDKDTALPYTGSFVAIGGIILVITIIGVVSFIQYRKYRKI